MKALWLSLIFWSSAQASAPSPPVDLVVGEKVLLSRNGAFEPAMVLRARNASNITVQVSENGKTRVLEKVSLARLAKREGCVWGRCVGEKVRVFLATACARQPHDAVVVGVHLKGELIVRNAQGCVAQLGKAQALQSKPDSARSGPQVEPLGSCFMQSQCQTISEVVRQTTASRCEDRYGGRAFRSDHVGVCESL